MTFTLSDAMGAALLSISNLPHRPLTQYNLNTVRALHRRGMCGFGKKNGPVAYREPMVWLTRRGHAFADALGVK